MKLTARNVQFMIKSQSNSYFASGKYGHWRNTVYWEKIKFEPWFKHSKPSSRWSHWK